MTFKFQNLDADTRKYMLAEIERDVQNGQLYLSRYFTDGVANQYEQLIREAAEKQNETWLAGEIRSAGMMKAKTQAKHPTKPGVMIDKDVPVTAADTFAEGEFNRFYCRGLCLRAIETRSQLEVYRAKPVANARSASEEMIGRRFDPRALLDDLRTSQGVDTALRLPPGPNSGLSVRVV